MRGLAVLLVMSGCTLPFVAKTAERSVETEALRVTVGPDISVEHDRVVFELRFDNDTDETLTIPLAGLVLEEDGRRRAVVALDRDVVGSVVIDARRSRRRSFQARAGDGERFVVRLEQATLGERSVVFEPLELVSLEARLREATASRSQTQLRLVGGVLISRTPPSPLLETVVRADTFVGTLEATFGYWSRWFEVSLLARGGNGRLMGLEFGVRPGTEALTLRLSYGLDMVQVAEGVIGWRDLLFGHGPRLMVEVPFDVRQLRLNTEAPKRFGAFVTFGASTLQGRQTLPHWVATVEAGLRWRVQ
ncbi:MAG: hypothetical protein ABTQ32_32065 [Myxococcaceae bacterium]